MTLNVHCVKFLLTVGLRLSVITFIIVIHLDVECTSCEIPVDSWSTSVCDNVYNCYTSWHWTYVVCNSCWQLVYVCLFSGNTSARLQSHAVDFVYHMCLKYVSVLHIVAVVDQCDRFCSVIYFLQLVLFYSSFLSARRHPSYSDCLSGQEGILSKLLCVGLCDTVFK